MSIEFYRKEEHIDGYGFVSGYRWILNIVLAGRFQMFFGWRALESHER